MLVGDAGPDTINSGDDDVTIYSFKGNDAIYSGEGNDTISSGDDNDILIGGEGNDSLDGGAGFDQARFDLASSDFTALKDGDVCTIVSAEGADTVTNVEEFVFTDTTLSADDLDARAGTITDDNLLLVGDYWSDLMIGGEGDDTASGGAGKDAIEGGAGNDWIFSGEDNDTIEGGSGDDLLFGGAGADTFVFKTGHDSDVIHDFELGIDTLRLSGALTGGKSAADIVSDYATITNGAVVFDFGGDDIITLSNLNSLTGLEENIEIF